MDAIRLLDQARKQGVVVKVDGDEVFFEGPADKEPIIKQLRDNRAAVLQAMSLEPDDSELNPQSTAPMSDEKQVSQAESLVQLALEMFSFGQTPSNDAFAVSTDGCNIALMLKASRESLRSKLARAFRQRQGRTPNASALADAMTVLAGEAMECETQEVALRVAAEGDGRRNIVIDLGTQDGSAVVVEPGGWTLVDRSPVLFRRTALVGALPQPDISGNLDTLRELLNVTPDSWPLLRGWLVASLIPGIPHPVLMLGGEQGTGKTTAAKMLVGLFDPSPAPLRSPPRDAESWALAAAGSWGVAIDNVSTIQGWWSDALCKAVTGDGWVRRQLYTDSELSVLSFRRVLLLTTIDAGALRGDLGDRLLLVDLEPITDVARRTDAQLTKDYERFRPLLFGGLLNLLAKVLAELPKVNLPRSPRMADFAAVLAAVDAADSGDGSDGRSLELYLGQNCRIAREVLESDPVAERLLAFLEQHGGWEGTAGELLQKLTPIKPPKGWPTSPRGMAGRLKRLTPAMRAVGWGVSRGPRTSHGQTYHIERPADREVEQSTVTTVTPSPDDGSVCSDGSSQIGSDEVGEL